MPRDGQNLRRYWAGLTARQRTALTAAAHAARRGVKDPPEVRAARAATRHVRGIGIGPHERAFAQLLDAEGVEYRQQAPFGPYSLDFSVGEDLIAVEVRSGGGNVRVSKARRERTERILEQRHLFEVVFATGHPRRISPEVTKHLVAFLQFARANPAAPREHRMVRPDGEAYVPRPYGRGKPRLISEEQIVTARRLRATGLGLTTVARRAGIPKRRIATLLEE